MLVGHVDRLELDYIGGWTADTDTPDLVEEVIIYVDGKRAAHVRCDRLRPDLRDRGDTARASMDLLGPFRRSSRLTC